MENIVVKIISVIVGLVLLVAAIIFISVVGLNLGPVKIPAIMEVASYKTSLEDKQNELQKSQSQYKTKFQELDNAKKDFKNQKTKYETISDETLNYIKESTKEQSYFIEYLWVTLGNYASAHKLSLAVIEPNGTVGSSNTGAQTTPDAGTNPNNGANTNTANGGTTNTNNTNTNTNTNNTNNTNTNTNNSNTNNNQNGQNNQNNNQQTGANPSITDGITATTDGLTVQIKGSYINVADFVFEVENDKSLMFKLDNISMKAGDGNNVIASFKVKNISIDK